MLPSVKELPERMILVAGEGQLPEFVAKNAVAKGVIVHPFCLTRRNMRCLGQITRQTPHHIHPGMMQNNLALAQRYDLRHVVFAGKVNKWILLQNPRLDAMALNALKQLFPRNDDGMMLAIIELLGRYGLTVWSQALFLENLLIGPRQLTHQRPTEAQWQDIRFGFNLAKAMGGLDVGQTVVVQHGMVLAIEAIEGTDRCLLRAGQLSRQKREAVVVKVAKPAQDERFDIPTVGLRTLKRMKQAGLGVLATEACQTLYLEPEGMVTFANHHGLSIISLNASDVAAVHSPGLSV